jgi:hypothetical protein
VHLFAKIIANINKLQNSLHTINHVAIFLVCCVLPFAAKHEPPFGLSPNQANGMISGINGQREQEERKQDQGG